MSNIGDDATEPWLRALGRELAERHAAHAVILYGSRARGAARSESDVDVLVVTSSRPSAARDARAVTDAAGRPVSLDAWVYAEDAAELDPERDPGILRVREGLVLVDAKGFGVGLLARCREVWARGPAALGADEIEATRVWLLRMLERIAGAETADTPLRRTAAHFRRCELVTQLLPIVFQVERWWYPGPEPALAEFLARRPDLFAAVAALADPATPLARLREVALALGARVFERT